MNERARLERHIREELDQFYEHTRFEEHEDEALKTVAHAVTWICMLDEFHMKTGGANYIQKRDADPYGQHLNGIRFARNRVMHQFAQVLEVVHGGAMFPARLPAPLYEIVWRPVSALPPSDPSHEARGAKVERAYRQLLEGQPVRFTFDAASDFLFNLP